jgi:hypothetical protein
MLLLCTMKMCKYLSNRHTKFQGCGFKHVEGYVAYSIESCRYCRFVPRVGRLSDVVMYRGCVIGARAFGPTLRAGGLLGSLTRGAGGAGGS